MCALRSVRSRRTLTIDNNNLIPALGSAPGLFYTNVISDFIEVFPIFDLSGISFFRPVTKV